MSQMMWNHVEALYRGQSPGGTVVTVDQDAMSKALQNAGSSVYDTEWWLETLVTVVEHWGLRAKRWVDPATQVLRFHFRLAPDQPTGGSEIGTGPLTTRILTNRLNSGNLNSGGLDSGKLRDLHR
jgi:hypothetical protein